MHIRIYIHVPDNGPQQCRASLVVKTNDDTDSREVGLVLIWGIIAPADTQQHSIMYKGDL